MREGNERPIHDGIARLRARWWRVSLLRHGLQGLFYLALVGALVPLAFPALEAPVVGVGLLALAALFAVLAAALRRPSAVQLAKDLDDAGGLADRVSSTLELEGARGPMVEALRAQAADVARAADAERVYRFEAPREGRWLPVPVLLVVAAMVVPGWLAEQPLADEAFDAAREQGLEALEELLSAESQHLPSERRKELLEELEKLKAQLSQEQVDRKDTQAEVAKLLEQMRQERDEEQQKEQELRKMLKSLQEDTGKKDLDPHLQQGDYQQALNKLREKMEELEKELERKRKKGATPEELKELEELLEKLKEIETKLLQLLQLDLDLQFMGQTIDFLAHWDGELGDLEDLEAADVLEPGEP